MTAPGKLWSPEDLDRARSLAHSYASAASISSEASPMVEAAKELATPSGPAYGAAFRSAAVVSRFRIEDLAPLADGRELQLLRGRSSAARVKAGSGWRTLLPEARLDVLRNTPVQALTELVGTDAKSDDPIRRALQAALRGIKDEELASMPAGELAALLQVYDGVPSTSAPLPPRPLIERKLELRRMLEPLEKITATFAGRQGEQQTLRNYVGVLPPDSILEAGKRWLSSFLPDRKPPFLIHGIGGVGKTTLVARFILDHALVGQRNQFPFVYIDFDRPVVRAEAPGTIFIEAVRQIGLQYETAYAAAERLRTRLRSTTQTTDKLVEEFARFLNTLEVQDGPVLFVLDTLEEVQSRNSAAAQGVLSLLDSLSKTVSRLRVVVASRIPVPTIAESNTLHLTVLDRESAIEYLKSKKVDEITAAQIYEQIGGSPLTLNLAVALYLQNPEETRRDGLGIDAAKLQDEVADVQLFDRILLHVDPEVQRIAHPGLTLRRITPEIIREVLAVPCEIDVPDDETAQRLFEKMASEVTLVTRVEPNVLVHLTHMRRLMLRPLRSAPGPKVEEIHRRAIEFYRGKSDQISRAEEVYHRLSLGQGRAEVESLVNPELEQYLGNAIEELAPPEQALLSQLLGREIPAEAARAADQETWERITSRRVQQLLSTGALEEARKLLGERTERSAQTDLLIAEATVLETAGRHADALSLADRGIGAYRSAGNSLLQFRMLLTAARIEREMQLYDPAATCIAAAEEIARRRSNALLLLQALRDQAQLLREEGRVVDAGLREDLRATAARCTETEWSQNLPLLRDVAVEIGHEEPAIVAKAIGLGAIELRSSDIEAAQRLLKSGKKDFLAAVREALVHDPVPRELIDIVLAAARPASSSRETRAQSSGTRVRLKADQKATFIDILSKKFGNSLGSFVERGLDRALEAISFAADVPTSAADLVRTAEREGWLTQLIINSVRARFDDLEVLQFAYAIGMGPTIRTASGPAALPEKRLKALIAEFRVRVAQLAARTCEIGTKKASHRSGILIDSYAVLTSANRENDDMNYLRFDREFISGVEADPGTYHEGRYAVPGPYGQIAIIDLSSPIGDWPIDLSRSDAYAARRGYFALPSEPRLSAREPLLWLWRDEEGIYISGAHDPVADYTEDGLLVIRASSMPAATGAAVVDASFNLVGVNCGTFENQSKQTGIRPVHASLRFPS